MSDLTGKRFRHIKRGTEYEVIGVGKMQTDCWGWAGDPSCDTVDMQEVVTYRSLADGSLWTRPREEFEDGRFEALDTLPLSDGVVPMRRSYIEGSVPPRFKPDPNGPYVLWEDANAALAATQERLGECNAGYETLVKELAAEKARADEAEAAQWRVFPNVHTVEIEGGRATDPFEGPGEMYHDAYHREKARSDTLAEALQTTKEACEIIAGKRQCLDNLMGNRDVAEAALVTIDAALATIPVKPETKPMDDMTKAARDVLAERRRQIEAEGWTPEHDDAYTNDELSTAAACYAAPEAVYWGPTQDRAALRWPWHGPWWKPKDRRRNLVKAGALILAEIERLDRIPAKPSTITFDADKVWDKGDRFDGPDPVALALIPAKPETEP